MVSFITERDELPELRETLGRALDRLTELLKTREDQKRRSETMDDFLNVRKRVARNEADMIDLRNSAAYTSPR